jgi:hypothetical protein
MPTTQGEDDPLTVTEEVPGHQARTTERKS